MTEKTLYHLLRERRGWTNEYLREINDPHHPPLKDLDVLVERLEQIRLSGEQLVVVPDFDVDGITSGIIGLAGFAELGFNTGLYLPDYHRGHDFGVQDVEDVLTQHPHAKALITCDVGISAHAGVDEAKKRGLQVFVTDHHLETQGRVNADVVIDPSRTDETYPNKGICGAHVIYQVIHAYTVEHQPDKVDDIELLKIFAALGTIADVMPLVYENRQLVKDAIAQAHLLYAPPSNEVRSRDEELEVDPERSTRMQLMRNEAHHPLFVSAQRGMAEVIAEFTRRRKLRSVADLDEGFFGFYLAPAFNSIRRIDGDLSDAFMAFFGDGKLDAITRILEGNELRKVLVAEYIEKIETEDQPFAPFVYFTDAPAGVLGLLANTLMQRAGSPVVVLGRPSSPQQKLSGSARAPMWYPLNSLVNAEEGMQAIGHEQACGVRVDSAARVDELVHLLEESSVRVFAEATADGTLAQLTETDLVIGESPNADISASQVEELLEAIGRLQALGPFGHGFESITASMEVDLARTGIRAIGSDKQHLAMVTEHGIKALWWNKADEMLLEIQEAGANPLPGASQVVFRGSLSVNIFNDVVNLDFIVDAIEGLPED